MIDSILLSALIFLRVHRKRVTAVASVCDCINVLRVFSIACSFDARPAVVRFIDNYFLQNTTAGSVPRSEQYFSIALILYIIVETVKFIFCVCFRRAPTTGQSQRCFRSSPVVVAFLTVMFLVAVATFGCSCHAKTDVHLQCLRFPVVFVAVVTVMLFASVVMRRFLYFASKNLMYHGWLIPAFVSGRRGFLNWRFSLALLIVGIVEFTVLMTISVKLPGGDLMIFMFDPLTFQLLVLFDFGNLLLLLEILKTGASHKEERNVLKDNFFSIGIESGMDGMISRVFARYDLTSKTPIVLDRAMNMEMLPRQRRHNDSDSDDSIW